MKRYINSAIILLAVLALASCSKTDEVQYNPDDALQIESVSGISPFSLTTKSVITEGTLPSEEASKGIGLFVTASDGGKYDGHDKGYSNVNFTFSSGEWSTQAPVYLSNTTGKLYGYFPYNSNANDLAAVPVQSSLNGTDYLYAEPKDVSHSNRSVSLTMNHALSRLHLTIRKGASFSAGATLSKIALKSTAIDATGTMNITTGAVSASKEPSQMGTVEFATDGSITAEGMVKDILLVPADNSEGKKGITVSLVINGESTEAILTGDNGIDIRSGIQYNLSLTLEDTGIKVEGIGVGVWGEGGSHTVEVGGYKVSIVFGNTITDPGDVLLNAVVSDDKVILSAYSRQRKVLSCNVGESATCSKTKNKSIFTFEISDINSSFDAVLEYAPSARITVSSNVNGKVYIGDDENSTSEDFEVGEKVSLHAVPNDGYQVYWTDNNREDDREITVGENDAAYTARFISKYAIPYPFSVSSTKQVFFSKGNLYYDGSKYCFEGNQYHTTSGNETSSHVGHFYWSSGKGTARSLLNYTDPCAATDDEFFANHPESFAVNGQTGWSVLTGGQNGEWYYLLNTRTDAAKKVGYATVCGKNGIILLPDDFEDPKTNTSTSCVGGAFVPISSTGWDQNVYTSGDNWNSMESAGAVFLPAAGSRDGASGRPKPALVNYFGERGYYWSVTPSDVGTACSVLFIDGYVDPSGNGTRARAFSVRLVTDIN